MTVRVCSHRLSMQTDVLNDPQQPPPPSSSSSSTTQQQTISNESDCTSTLSTTLIYSGLKLHPKPLVPTISMSSRASPVSIVKKLPTADTHPDNSTKTLGSSIRHSPTSSTPSSIRLVTPTTGKSSPPTTLQLQFLDKTSTLTSNGGFSASKAYIFNPQQSNSAGTPTSPLVTLIPPGTTSPKIQTLISSTNDLTNNQDSINSKQSSFLPKNRLTLFQPIITNSSSTLSSTNTVAPKLVIQQNSAPNIWSQPPKTKIVSAKMLSRPVHLISSNEHSTLPSPTSPSNPIFTTKNLDAGHQAYFPMPLLSLGSTNESFNPVQLTNFSSVRISTSQRPMDHNNNHSITTPIIREMAIDEKINDTTIIPNMHHNRNSFKNRARLPLQPSTQQISSVFPTSRKHKLSEDEHSSLSEPPNKIPHYEQFDSSSNGKQIRKSRHRSSSKVSIENTTPANPSSSSSSSSSSTIDTNGMILSKKRSCAEIAAAAILSSNHMRKKRVQKKKSDEILSHNNSIKQELLAINHSSIEMINDELLRRLSQDFVYVDKTTGLRWIATKARSQPMNTLSARVSWKPKINHYEKYSDIIRTNPKRTVPVKSFEIIRKKLSQPGASWRIDRLTTYLTDLTQDEQMTQNNLSDMAQLLDQMNINDHTIRNTIEDLFEGNIQRHRYFCEQLTQVSTLLVSLLDHGNTIKEISSTAKSPTITNASPTSLRRTKDR